jgi:hypothetical protein
MSEQADDELRLLALAFDRAWKRYYRRRRIDAVSEHIARPALAKHLIARAREGVISPDALAEGGFKHLVSLTPEAQYWGHLTVEGAAAKLLPVWRIRSTSVHGHRAGDAQ